jgi:hypothetical protein
MSLVMRIFLQKFIVKYTQPPEYPPETREAQMRRGGQRSRARLSGITRSWKDRLKVNKGGGGHT